MCAETDDSGTNSCVKSAPYTMSIIEEHMAIDDACYDPTYHPTYHPTYIPSSAPSQPPSSAPSTAPTNAPSLAPTGMPSESTRDYCLPSEFEVAIDYPVECNVSDVYAALVCQNTFISFVCLFYFL